jgi:hypothetical protein
LCWEAMGNQLVLGGPGQIINGLKKLWWRIVTAEVQQHEVIQRSGRRKMVFWEEFPPMSGHRWRPLLWVQEYT